MDTTIKYLDGVVGLLRRFSRLDQKIVLTVSPVPLLATFTDNDVIVANCYSKSLLRVAAEYMRYQYANVDYYPSYESVTLSDRQTTWLDDLHHVEDAIVRFNVGRMVSAYVQEPQQHGDATRSTINEAKQLRSVGDFWGAYAVMKPVAADFSEPTDLLMLAEICQRVKRTDDALAALRRISITLQPQDWRLQLGRAKLFGALGAWDEARRCADELLSVTSSNSVRDAAQNLIDQSINAEDTTN